MTRNVKVFLSLFMVFFLLSVFATVTLAEPEVGETTTDAPAETTDTPAETTDTPTETTDDTTTSEPSVDLGEITVTGDTANVSVYFNGETEAKTAYQAEVGSEVSVRAEAKEGYKITQVTYLGMPVTLDANGTFSFTVAVHSIGIHITTESTGDEPNPSDDPNSSGDPTSTEDPNTTDEPNPSDDPSSSVDPSSTEDPSSGTSSDPGISDPPANQAELSITITGAGTVSANNTSVANSGNLEKTGSIMLTINEATALRITPAYGYKLSSLKLDGQTRELTESMTITISELTTLEVVFEPDTVAPTTYQILVSCATSGGYVTAGGYTITSGNATTININAGGSLVISVFPADGYEVDAFKVGGVAQNLSGGSYTLENIAASANVTVTFKEVTTQIVPVEATDFTWTANENKLIVIDLGSNTYIGKSVFDKINTLTAADGDYVVLQTAYVRWYIPCGSTIEGVTENYFRLSVAMNSNGSYFGTIDASIRAQDPETVFQYYELTASPEFPEGTLASFNIADLASAYNGNDVELMVKSGNALVVAGNGSIESTGWTTRMNYRNSRYLVVRIDVADQYTITASAVQNGSITPAGSNSVKANSDSTFTVTPAAGYIISAVYVDDVAIAGAAGRSSYSYIFSKVTANHTIRAEFIPADSTYQIVGNVAVIQEESSVAEPEPEDSNAGLIVALVIIFVAIAGAAALFIVKWRQEKF